MGETDILDRVRDLLDSQQFGVLATREDNFQPYANLVAFAVDGGPGRLLFATQRATRKFHNLECEPRVAILVDNRSNAEVDLREAIAVTVLGKAAEVPHTEREEKNAVFLAKHPTMSEFIRSPNCAMLEVAVDRIYVVSRFQSVTEIRFSGGAAQVVDPNIT